MKETILVKVSRMKLDKEHELLRAHVDLGETDVFPYHSVKDVLSILYPNSIVSFKIMSYE